MSTRNIFDMAAHTWRQLDQEVPLMVESMLQEWEEIDYWRRALVVFGQAGWYQPHDGSPGRYVTQEELAALDAPLSVEVPAGVSGRAGFTNTGFVVDPVTGHTLIPDFTNNRIVELAHDGAYVNESERVGDPPDEPEPDEPEPIDFARDASRGALLCETCFDCMTSRVVPAERSGTGLAMAQCDACARKA